jgi:uncharacterized membrane protein
MFPGGIVALLKQVITSWQVIVVTLGFILSVFVINFVARSHHRTRKVKKLSFAKKKAKPAAAAGDIDVTSSSSSSNDELGLEEQ